MSVRTKKESQSQKDKEMTIKFEVENFFRDNNSSCEKSRWWKKIMVKEQSLEWKIKRHKTKV